MSLHVIAQALGGQVTGPNTISIPTTGHSCKDRGTTITLDPAAPGGLLVNSFNGGDPLAVKDRVRELLGMPAWEHGERREESIRSDRAAPARPAIVSAAADRER